jgi:FkbM family methyltransferase
MKRKEMKAFFKLLLGIVITPYCFGNELDLLPFKSQCGQDKYVLKNFFTDNKGNLKKDGFFIEFGAFDGVGLSNSYALEQIGWKGICIEPIPEMFQKLKNNRNCICIEGCVSDKHGTAYFREVGGTFEVLSGIEDKYNPTHIHLINNVYNKPSKFYEVQCYTLSEILREYNVEKVDFLSIDTEGGELEIVKSLSDDELKKIDVICVEHNDADKEMIRFLTSKNFTLIRRLEFDLIFRNNIFKN